ncbi:PAS domain S-box [Cylindrospermum stagnale PCC 7417]|uniref:histidine kinase n=1 Tax=Cylindrospermum stagnale PCC 7417 TaxID=56107 RepID=K9WSS6_9NOST|nr:PAS domain-containing protein [Cylindrospermum stagnale]AFZ22836.1 PAS domain S-box [Cylindrospermum stagnale PCC 7417]
MFPEIVSDLIDQIIVVGAEIQRSEQLLSQQADTEPLMIWMAGSDGVYHYFNAVWGEFTGQCLDTDRFVSALAEDNSNIWACCVHPEDRQRCEDRYHTAFAVHDSFQRQYRLRHQSGEYRWILDTAVPRFAADGSFLGYVGYLVDFTDVEIKEIPTQESEVRLRLALNRAQMGVWDWQITTGKFNLSQGTDALFGMNPGDFAGTYEAFLNCIHHEDRHSVTEAMHNSVVDGSNCDIDFRIVLGDCTVHWLQIQGNVLRNKNGKSVLMMGAVMSITKRKLTEAALEAANQNLKATVEKQAIELETALKQLQSEIKQRCQAEAQLCQKNSQLAAILQSLPDLYFRLDADGNVLDYQVGKTQNLSSESGVFQVQQILEFFPPAVRVRFQEAITQVLATKSSVSFDYTLPPPFAKGHIQASLSPLPEQQIIVLVRDHSESTQASAANFQAIAQREALINQIANQIRASLELNSILETAVQEIHKIFQIDRCAFVWYRQNTDLPYWEVVSEAKYPHLKTLLGFKPTNAEIGPIATKVLNKEIIQIDHVATELDPIARQFFSDLGFTAFMSLPIHTQCGEIGAFTCSYCSGFRPWQESEVELLQAVSVQLAIAIDQAKLYQQSRTAAITAEQKAQQLEVALVELSSTQAQLIQTEKMSSLGHLVAGVAHEINNPVNFIYGNISHASEYISDLLHLIELYQQHYVAVPEIQQEIEAIDLDFLSEDLPKILDSMNMGAERIRQIVLSLRNFSRLDEAGMKPVDIHEGIDNTLLLLQNRLKAKLGCPEIKVSKEYGNLPEVNCYAAQLNQVFMNLLVNAIDALEESSVKGEMTEKPKIRIRTLIQKGDCAERSAGGDRLIISIADNGPGMSAEVKNRLFDPFFTTKPVGKGTGIGLSISYQIVVEKHLGKLECISAPGEGAQFVVTIPLK